MSDRWEGLVGHHCRGFAGSVHLLHRECLGCQSGIHTGHIDNYRRVLAVRSIVLEKVDVADHADQLAFVHDGHGTEFVESQKISHLVKRCIR